jgi:hypothetical protein
MFIQVAAITTEIIAMLTNPVPEDWVHCETGRCSACRISLNRP